MTGRQRRPGSPSTLPRGDPVLSQDLWKHTDYAETVRAKSNNVVTGLTWGLCSNGALEQESVLRVFHSVPANSLGSSVRIGLQDVVKVSSTISGGCLPRSAKLVGLSEREREIKNMAILYQIDQNHRQNTPSTGSQQEASSEC